MGALGVDLVSISGHKICGPGGVSALVGTRRALRGLEPLLHGGGHERGLRSGSLNTTGAVGFGAAARIAAEERESEAARVGALRDRLVESLKQLEGVFQNGDTARRLPTTASIRFTGADAEAVAVAMDPVAMSRRIERTRQRGTNRKTVDCTNGRAAGTRADDSLCCLSAVSGGSGLSMVPGLEQMPRVRHGLRAMNGDRGLGVLDHKKLTWRLPEDSVADEVLIPGLRSADGFDCMVGFFSGRALRQLAPGLASYISRGAAPMRLLISPVLTKDDLAAVQTGITTPADVIADALGVALHDEAALADALAVHTLECLAYLLAGGRLEMKVVLIDGGVFHLKEWILHAAGDIAVLSGSANFTNRALTGNFESLHLHRSWRDHDNLDTCQESVSEFELLWNGRKPGASTFNLPSAVADDLITTYAKGEAPTEADFYRARAADDTDPTARDAATPQTAAGSPFRIPGHLDIHHGAYAHQGRAIQAWEHNGRRGILAMATGSGKTITALAAAKRLQEQHGRLLIVISVPTRPLLAQWQHECTEFGLRPVVAPALAKPKRLNRVQLAISNLELSVTDTEAVISTNAGLVEPDLNRLIADFSGCILLISDEVHNLGGTKAFLEDPPLWAEARLGLSATPVRQYDDDGTRRLFDYFGDVVFEFDLEDAIGLCLLPYDYLLHSVHMTEEEAEQYTDLSRLIGRHIARNAGSGGKPEPDGKRLTYLLNQRRLLLETASGKLQVLECLLDEAGPSTIRRTLFYATDKTPEQLSAVNAMLRSRRVRSHQITEAETSQGKLMGEVLRAFESGTLHALTAKRVLDEGLNVPQIDTAYLLASTTVEKQWVQRRGRVLRPSPATGKTHAVIHDFVVLPPENASKDRKETRFLKGELERCDEFARLARNRAEHNGPYAIINDIQYEYLV